MNDAPNSAHHSAETGAKKDAYHQYAKRQSDKYSRLSKYSLDPENQQMYGVKEKQWKRVYFRTGDMTPMEYAASRSVSRSKNYTDVTDEWFEKATPNSHNVVKMTEIEHEGIVYKVDGKHIILDPRPDEIKVADLIKQKLGGEISILPRIVYPRGIKTPDYILNEEKYDLKSPEGCGKHTLYGMVKDKKEQAYNFIFDISNCGISVEEVVAQIENDVYRSSHTRFVDKVILIDGDNIVKIYERKKTE